MWIFDARNFTSTVVYDPKKDDLKGSRHRKLAEAAPDAGGGWLLVRARIKEDLTNLQSQLRKVYGKKFSIHIQEDKSADYTHRALLTREQFKAYLARQVDEMNYGAHFKEVVKANTTAKAEARYKAMMDVWTAMSALQDDPPYGAWTSGSSSHYYGGDAWSYGAKTGSTVFTAPATWFSVEEVVEQLLDSGTEDLEDMLDAATDRAFILAFAAIREFPEHANQPFDVADVDELLNRTGLNKDTEVVDSVVKAVKEFYEAQADAEADDAEAQAALGEDPAKQDA